ncbi:MAG: arylsulfatase [Microthrixaceae bacterium]|nr:arylsulfatase [Microthrixaceae bacterium]
MQPSTEQNHGIETELDPYAGFTGTVGRVYATSEPGWKDRTTAPEGAPNVIVMLCDDLGYSDIGCYGSEIPTPNLDRIAEEGLRYTDFHSTPMCSPTRAALLTGLEPHRAGLGYVAHADAGFPGYAMQLTDLAPTLPELLRDNGYQTLMLGKWHLTKDSEQNDAGDRSSWPLQKGFDRYYGFLDAFTNLHQPHRLFEDNHAIDTDEFPEGYYLSDDLTDRAISMIRESKASDPTKPFFMYFAHGAVHAPLHAKEPDIERHADRYREGWQVIRERRYQRQLELGVIPEGALLSDAPDNDHDSIQVWDDLDDERKLLFAKYMEVYAAMVDNIDQNVGRLREALEQMGEWDNTLFIFTSDNGASREGEAEGTSAYMRTLHFERTGLPEPFEEDFARVDRIGGPTTYPHYPRGWAWVGNTPFRYYKINAHRGGHSVPFVVSWPARISDRGQIRNQYMHITDLLPTLLQLTGTQRPAERNGKPVLELTGEDLSQTLFSGSTAGRSSDVVFECEGHRGYRSGEWEAVARHEPRTAFDDDMWELFDMASDPSQVNDLALQHPEILERLKVSWESAAWQNQIYPLDEGTGLRFLLRPPGTERFDEPLTLFAGMPTLDRWRSQRLILWRDFDVTARVTLADGDCGVLFAHGDQSGGYAMYIDVSGELLLVHNGYGIERQLRGPRVEPGDHELTLRVTCPGEYRWDMAILVDGEVVASGDGFRLLMAMSPFNGIDVGVDRRSPVSWDIYQRHGCFRFSGDLRSVTYSPGDPAPDSPMNFIELLRDWGRQFE